jgi:hypothetical protein
MVMFLLSCSILLMCVWVRYKMRNANRAKERIQALILPRPLHDNNFTIKYMFNKGLKFFKEWKNFRFVM